MENKRTLSRQRICNIPPNWDMCRVNGKVYWRCPEFRVFKNGEIRRCIVCKKKSKWMQHLNGHHIFTISQANDDPKMIAAVTNRIAPRSAFICSAPLVIKY